MKNANFKTHMTNDNHKIVEIVLNSEHNLNALSLEMVDQIQATLDEYRTDDSVVAFILDSVGEKAFCAGGDVVSLFKKTDANDIKTSCEAFFGREYILDFSMHKYPKPIICWGNGIVMGGGMGLLSASSHKIVTETSRLAMPEVAIGFYPDVGGSWFLNRLPTDIAGFLGLTGCSINGVDAVSLGLADFIISSKKKLEMLTLLKQQNWGVNAHKIVDSVLIDLEEKSKDDLEEKKPTIEERKPFIKRVMREGNLSDICRAIEMEPLEDKWLERVKRSIKHGSPLAAEIFLKLIRKARHLSLSEAFKLEIITTLNCAMTGDFPEGVRALLIRKDHSPNWKYKTPAEISPEIVDGFFVAPLQDNLIDSGLRKYSNVSD